VKLSYRVRRDLDAAFAKFRVENPFDPNGDLDGYMLRMWHSAANTGMNMQRKRTLDIENGEAPIDEQRTRTIVTVRKRRAV
jgi:hypothetical protein